MTIPEMCEIKPDKISPEFFKKEQESFKRINEESKQFKKDSEMSYEKFHTPFTI